MPIPIMALLGVINTAKQLVDMYEDQKKKHNEELQPIAQIDMAEARKHLKKMKEMLNAVDLDEEVEK